MAREYQRDVQTYINDERIRPALDDGFEPSNMDWASSGTGSIARDTTKSKDGEASLKLTTGAGASDSISAIRYTGIPQSGGGLFVAKCDFMTNDDPTTFTAFDFELNYKDGTTRQNPLIRWDASLELWKVFQTGGTYQSVSELDSWYYLSGSDVWHSIEIVADLAQSKYAYVRIDGVKVNIPTVSLFTSSDTQVFCQGAFTLITGSGGGAKSVYVDNCFIGVL